MNTYLAHYDINTNRTHLRWIDANNWNDALADALKVVPGFKLKALHLIATDIDNEETPP